MTYRPSFGRRANEQTTTSTSLVGRFETEKCEVESKRLTRGFKRSLVFIFLAIFSATAFSKDAISFYIENDSRRFKPNHATDRHYTNGIKLVYLTQPDWQWLGDLENKKGYHSFVIPFFYNMLLIFIFTILFFV